jgi:hypothetical protein
MIGGPYLSAARCVDGVPLRGGELLGWAGLLAWAESVPRALSSLFPIFLFLFLFYLKTLDF